MRRGIFLVSGNTTYSYERFLSDLSTMESASPWVRVQNNSTYEVFLRLSHSLLHGYPVTLLDGDLSPTELIEMGILPREVEQAKDWPPIVVTTMAELLSHFNQQGGWSVSLFTSGTTGRPKLVRHSFSSLTRTVRQGGRYANQCWAFAYNPTHMAGLQVFFQALLNQNLIVDVFGDEARNLGPLLTAYNVTHISATPTYFRSTLPYLNGTWDSLQRVTLGGERYDARVTDLVQNRFPNAEIRNIYASTELGALFTARGDLFEIPSALTPLIEIRNGEELYVHRALLGDSDSIQLAGDWFATGDLVEMVDVRRFRFRSRRSDFINVGGYKVNPSDVEAVILNVPGVLDVHVKARANPVTGQILSADVVRSPGMDERSLKVEIKRYAAEHLQPWKVPRLIHFVDTIEKTRSGKKVRK